jgi:hypothetical protein
MSSPRFLIGRIAQGSKVIDTSCGPIEVQEGGAGVPLLAVHSSGGGFDQGMAFAAPLAKQGIRVIASTPGGTSGLDTMTRSWPGSASC